MLRNKVFLWSLKHDQEHALFYILYFIAYSFWKKKRLCIKLPFFPPFISRNRFYQVRCNSWLRAHGLHIYARILFFLFFFLFSVAVLGFTVVIWCCLSLFEYIFYDIIYYKIIPPVTFLWDSKLQNVVVWCSCKLLIMKIIHDKTAFHFLPKKIPWLRVNK